MAKKTQDILQKKKQELAAYAKQADGAVSTVTSIISNLGVLNAQIDEKIKEIDEYQNELLATRAGLDETKARNEKVIKNFNALLGNA